MFGATFSSTPSSTPQLYYNREHMYDSDFNQPPHWHLFDCHEYTETVFMNWRHLRYPWGVGKGIAVVVLCRLEF